jgi:hypothetical protein
LTAFEAPDSLYHNFIALAGELLQPPDLFFFLENLQNLFWGFFLKIPYLLRTTEQPESVKEES